MDVLDKMLFTGSQWCDASSVASEQWGLRCYWGPRLSSQVYGHVFEGNGELTLSVNGSATDCVSPARTS